MQTPPEPDDDVAALAPNGTVRLAATLVILGGFLTTLSGFQIFISITFVFAWARPIPWLMLATGLVTMYAGAQLYRTRGWAAVASIVCSAVLALGMGAWVWFAATHGFLSCLTVLVPLGAPVALIFSVKSLPACRLADQVRQRMEDAGMDLGL